MSQKGYFILLGNTHIFVYYNPVSYPRIKVYRVEIMDMVKF